MNQQMSKRRQPTAQQIRDLRDHPRKGPVQMINLLKFRDRAQYKPGEVDDAEVSGEVAYWRYGKLVGQFVAGLGGRIIWSGTPEVVAIGDGEDLWDQAVIVEYPSREAFMAMISMPEYQAAHVHREAGLDHQKLIECRPGGEAIS
jgi:uncharacterized protein (DUF1330 family)